MTTRVVLTALVLGLLSFGQGHAADIRGRLVSSRIDSFENFVVYIKHADPKTFKAPAEPVRSVREGMRIIPRVLPVVARSKVTFVNRDRELHNIHTVLGAPAYFNFGVPPDSEYGPVRLPRQGEVMLLCDIHPQIQGYILVLQNPYFSAVDREGRFTIIKVPAGRYELWTWSEEYKSLSLPVTVGESGGAVEVEFKY